jgi:hypothetical protein
LLGLAVLFEPRDRDVLGRTEEFEFRDLVVLDLIDELLPLDLIVEFDLLFLILELLLTADDLLDALFEDPRRE